MKKKRNFWIGVIVGGLTIGTLELMGLPFIVRNSSFLLGFIVCLTLVALGLILRSIRAKDSDSEKPSNKKSKHNQSRLSPSVWIFASTFLILAGIVSSYLIYKQNELSKAQTLLQEQTLQQQAELIESVKKSSFVHLMGNILDKADREIENNPQRILSKETIARIADLSYALKPYQLLPSDSLAEKKYSPERGQLLLTLVRMSLDSGSFAQIKAKATFSRADLEKSNLGGADLSGIDLQEANLRDANASNANLQHANLEKAILWGANLNHANLSKSNLKRANLQWAEMNESHLDSADLSGVNLNSAKLRKAKMPYALFLFADLTGAFFHEADMQGVSLRGVNLTRVNFHQANLSQAYLRRANLTETNLAMADLSEADIIEASLPGAELTQANLTKTLVREQDWFEKLEQWSVVGASEVQKQYEMVLDSTSKAFYRLEKK